MCIIGKHPWCRSLLRKLSILNINKQNWSKYILRCRHSKTCTVKNYTTGLTIRGPAATRVIPSKDWKLRYHLRGILVNRPKTAKKTQYPHKFIKSSYPPKRNLPKFSHQKQIPQIVTFKSNTFRHHKSFELPRSTLPFLPNCFGQGLCTESGYGLLTACSFTIVICHLNPLGLI